jgi:hypothetical protein
MAVISLVPLDAFVGKPVRGSLIIVDGPHANETFTFPMNPTELEESISVNYQDQAVIGLSHPVDQYVNTAAHSFPAVEFYVDGHAMSSEAGRNLSSYQILEFKRVLQSLTVPCAAARDVPSGAPPRVRFIWPGVVHMLCRVRTVSFRYLKFSQRGEPLVYLARVAFTETRLTRITHERIMTLGSERSESDAS